MSLPQGNDCDATRKCAQVRSHIELILFELQALAEG